MERKTFWREKTTQRTKSYVMWGVMGGVFLCINSAITSSIYGSLSFAVAGFIGALAFCLYFWQSRACACVLLGLYVFSNAVGAYLYKMDVMSWILLLVIGYALVCGMLGAFSFHREWKTFRETGALPPEPDKKN